GMPVCKVLLDVERLLEECFGCMVMLSLFGTLGQHCVKLVKILCGVGAFPVLSQALHSISPGFVTFSLDLAMYSCRNSQYPEQKSRKLSIRCNCLAQGYLMIYGAVISEEVQANC